MSYIFIDVYRKYTRNLACVSNAYTRLCRFTTTMIDLPARLVIVADFNNNCSGLKFNVPRAFFKRMYVVRVDTKEFVAQVCATIVYV